jgi:hypothetical protein
MASWFKDEIEELRKVHAEAVAQGYVGQPLADHIGPKIGRSPQSVKWALKTYLGLNLGREKRISTKPGKPKRLTDEQRKNLVRMVNSLLDEGTERDDILQLVAKRFNISRNGAIIAIARNGIKFPPAHCHNKRVQKKETEAHHQVEKVKSMSVNIDTGKHPYYIAARILDEMPGMTAEVRDGVCFLNGFPYPAMKFLEDAGVELPQ